MMARIAVGAIILGSALIAWFAITVTVVARALQAVVAISLVYVAYLALRGYQAMRNARRARASQAVRPWVTLMVAARNEAPVIEATLADLVRQDYGDASGPRFDILVVDDGSSDQTGELARAVAAEHPGRVRVVQRDPDNGPQMKGAALAFAQGDARGEVIGVVDADARASAAFLTQVMDAWASEPAAAAIQAQRRAHNRGGSWFAAAQDEELLMDMASQCGRHATDGTAELRGNGMFVRRAALERVGGWEPTALTEDLELSTRLVTAGERIALAPVAEVAEEGVMTLPGLWRQRLRWAEGSMRRLIELGPALLRSERVSLSRKLDFLAFTGEFLIPPLFVTTVIASLLTIPLPRPADWTVPASLFGGYGMGSFLLAMAGIAAQGERGAALVARAGRGSLFLSHWLIVVPAALLRIAIGREAKTFVQTRRAGHLPER
jgi:1,2-diacylglycerol 3-beta-glucosyltransferase